MDEPKSSQVSKAVTPYVMLRRRILIFAVLFSTFVVLAAGLGFAALRVNMIDEAKHRAESYSHILSAHLDRTVTAIDARLQQIALQSPRLGGPGGDRDQWRSVLEAARAGPATIGSISVADAEGIIRQSTLDRLVGAVRQDRLLNQLLAQQGGPEFVSDAPMRSPAQTLIVPFGRRLYDANGKLEGSVVATFVPEALRTFYKSVDTEGGMIRVLHASGPLVLEEPSRAHRPLGADDDVLSAFASGKVSAVLIGRIGGEGPTYITSYSAVTDHGLIVAVSLSEAQALAAWRLDALVASVLTAAVLIAFWITIALMMGQLRAREAAEAELEDQRARSADAQRLEAVGQLTGGVAHDFNNLLTVILNSADSLLTRVADDARPRVDAILHAAENGASLVRQLLAFSRKQTLSLAPLDMNAAAASMEDILRRTLGARIEIHFVLAPDLWRAVADKSQVESALLNLAINARDAMPEGGKLTIETHNAHLDEDYARHNIEVAPGDYVALAVTDSGAGMSPEVLQRALEPFFTTKEVGKGTGLGLSMIYGFAKQSRGHLKIYSELGRGTTVRLYLPRDIEGVASQIVAEQGADIGGDETILLVEDDPQVRALASATLRERGYTVIEAVSGDDAVATLDAETPVHLMLTDIIMPGKLTGRELAEYAFKAKPGIKVLFSSGYSDASVMRNGLLRAGARFLSKPYRGAELARVVRAMLDS